MGVKIIVDKKENEKPMSDEALAHRLINGSKSKLTNQVSFDLADEQMLKDAKRYRDDWNNLSRTKNMRQYLMMPQSVHKIAEMVLGKDFWKRDNKQFKKFLEMDFFYNGVKIKGEAFLTLPKDKL